MSVNILVLWLDDSDGAEAMLTNVNTWAEEGLIKVDDAVVVSQDTTAESITNQFITSVCANVEPGSSFLYLLTSSGNA